MHLEIEAKILIFVYVKLSKKIKCFCYLLSKFPRYFLNLYKI